MSKVQRLRSLVNQRLAAATEEIFGLFERTIAEYEEENRRQQKILEAIFNPDVQLHNEDVQQLMLRKDILLEQQEQENPAEPAHIKEEQEEVWSSQETGEADISRLMFKTVLVNSKEEEPQSFRLDENQRKENRGIELLKKEVDGEDCGGSEPDRDFNPHSHLQPVSSDETSDLSGSDTDDSADWQSDEPQEGLNPLQDKDGAVCDVSCEDPSVSSSQRPKKYQQNGETNKLFCCPVCGKKYTKQRKYSVHMSRHSEHFSRSVCQEAFPVKAELEEQTRVHTGERSFSCSVCGKGFSDMANLASHLKLHKGANIFLSTNFTKILINKKSSSPDNTKIHARKQRICSFCGKSFAFKKDLIRHIRIHTGEKPFVCSVCGRGFALKHYLKIHLTVHTGEKPFSCSVCGKKFSQRGSLGRHMASHSGEKRFSCDICGRGFTRRVSVKKHKLSFHKSSSSWIKTPDYTDTPAGGTHPAL